MLAPRRLLRIVALLAACLAPALGASLAGCGQGTPGSASAPAGGPAPSAALDGLPDTLASIPSQPEFWDEDPSRLLPRLASKLERGSAEARRLAIDWMAGQGEEAVPEILRVLERNATDPAHFGVAVNACEALARTRTSSPAAREALVRLLRHASGTVRTSASRALGQLGRPEAIEPLWEAFLRADAVERVAILRDLGKIDDALTDERLAALVADAARSAAERQSALEILASRPVARVGDHLAAALDEPTPLPEIASLALLARGDDAAIALARRLATDVRGPLAPHLGAKASLALALSGDLDAALAALRDGDANTRLHVGVAALRGALAGGALAASARTRALEGIRLAAGDADTVVRLEAIRTLRDAGEMLPLEDDLEDLASSDPIRESAGLTVTTDLQVADPRAVPILISKLRAAPFVRKRGYAQALGRLADPRAATVLEEFLDGPSERTDGILFADYAAIQLSNLGGAGLAALERGLERVREPGRRIGIVRAIAGSTEDAAKPILERIASDRSEHREIRAVAIRAFPRVVGLEGARILKRLLATETDELVRRLLNATLWELY